MDNRRRQTKRGLLMAAILILIALAVRFHGGSKGEYIGTFDVSHYCLEVWEGEYHICGNSPYGCGGDRLVPGESLAVPGSVLEKYPVGTKVMLRYPDGKKETLVIQDTGRALERLWRLDLPVSTHKEALSRGVIEDVELYKIK